MKRIIILINEQAQPVSLKAFTTLSKLFSDNEYCELHKYRIRKNLAKTGEYRKHSITVLRIIVNK